MPGLKRSWPGLTIIVLGFVAAGLAGPSARAQSSADPVVSLAPGQTIRDVAQQYLGDPDLWQEVLKASGIASITDVRPGIRLTVPTTAVSAANEAIDQSLLQIQAANSAGAQIFAPDEIGKAINLHDAALLKRIEREWEPTRLLAVQSRAEATNALELSEASRDLAAEALVSDRQGDVEGQRPQDLAWRGLDFRAILIEEERVRTLSDSTAQITFRDASRLRLNANSNAIIQRMRFDPLKRTEEARVSLVEGDFYALLSDDQSGRTSFEVDVPQVNANITSGNFWVGQREDGAKFANYDDEVVEVSAGGETVTLGRNEGTVVGADQRPMAKLDVLPAPTPTGPGDGEAVYSPTPELSWSTVDDAAGYWLELAQDQNYDQMVISRFGLETNSHQTEPLTPGDYYWRIAALDAFGLPGARSPSIKISIVDDRVPPYLAIGAPAEAAILRDASVTITGESEQGASLTINGEPVAVADDGSFSATITATEGDNLIVAIATDPARNQTERQRRFVHMADQVSVVAFDAVIPRLDDGTFVTDNPVVSLAGRTTVDATVEIRPAGADAIRASAVADGDGRFKINLPLTSDKEAFRITVVAPSGFATDEEIAVLVDATPPVIELDRIPLRLTADPNLVFAGSVDADAGLTIAGAPVGVADGRFEQAVTLQPGTNSIELTATDRAGNVTVETWTIIFDGDAPELVSSSLTPAGAGAMTVEIVASDTSGLAKVAPVTVVSDQNQYTAHLRYNRAAGAYQGTVPVPGAAQANAVIARVELQDDAGNRNVLELN